MDYSFNIQDQNTNLIGKQEIQNACPKMFRLRNLKQNGLTEVFVLVQNCQTKPNFKMPVNQVKAIIDKNQNHIDQLYEIFKKQEKINNRNAYLKRIQKSDFRNQSTQTTEQDINFCKYLQYQKQCDKVNFEHKYHIIPKDQQIVNPDYEPSFVQKTCMEQKMIFLDKAKMPEQSKEQILQIILKGKQLYAEKLRNNVLTKHEIHSWTETLLLYQDYINKLENEVFTLTKQISRRTEERLNISKQREQQIVQKNDIKMKQTVEQMKQDKEQMKKRLQQQMQQQNDQAQKVIKQRENQLQETTKDAIDMINKLRNKQ